MLEDALHRLTGLTTHREPETAGTRVHRILETLENASRSGSGERAFVRLLNDSKARLFDCLRDQFPSEVVAKALTLKILNLCLSKHHFLARSSTLVSRPFGLNIDPSDACNLACPGCVHSQHVKELKLFSWDKNVLSTSRLSALLETYGPYAIHVVFCNYGEPLLNPKTPELIRLSKQYLIQAMISTNLSIGKFDAPAYVESGLDYAIVSIDGATQAVYEKFRRNGRLDLVLDNIRKLVEARRALGKGTPVIAWRFLTFEHNVHEVPAAIEMARELGVDQFLTLTPYDVSWDDPSIRPVEIEPVNMVFNPQAESSILENWCPFPESLPAVAVEREFARPWGGNLGDAEPAGVSHNGTCQWLYKSITMDGGGRIFPCCAPPRPDIELLFARFDDGAPDPDLFNSDHYRMARLSFQDPDAYRQLVAARPTVREPHCANCEWGKDHVNTDGNQVRHYLRAAGRQLFDPASVAILSNW